MNLESVALSAVGAIGRRSWLSNALFGWTKWGNPFGDERFSWPYPMYERMRADGAVSFARAYNQWFVLGHDEVREVLTTPSTSNEAAGRVLLGISQYKKLSPQARENFGRWLLLADGPEHTRLRSAVSRAFTPRKMAEYAPLVEKTSRRLLDALPARGEIDIVETFTDRLPIEVIGELLGLPEDQRPWLHRASREVAQLLEPITPFDPSSMSERFRELDEYFDGLIADRRKSPRQDLISALVATDGESALTNDEVVSMITLLLTGGHETVTGVLGNAVLALSQNPDQRELLRSEPELIDNAVLELLRYDTSAQVSARQATADFSLAGHKIKAGQNIGLFVGAANRDPRTWDNPNDLRLDRENPAPLSFGFGAHYCIGAALARMELSAALPPLLDHLGDYSVDPDRISWKRSFTLRAATKMPLEVG